VQRRVGADGVDAPVIGVAGDEAGDVADRAVAGGRRRRVASFAEPRPGR
jgi:hypothetical protein